MQYNSWSDSSRIKYMRAMHACVTNAGNEQNYGGWFVVGKSFSHDLSKILMFSSNKWTKVGRSPLESLRDHAVTKATSPDYFLYSIGGHENVFFVKSSTQTVLRVRIFGHMLVISRKSGIALKA